MKADSRAAGTGPDCAIARKGMRDRGRWHGVALLGASLLFFAGGLAAFLLAGRRKATSLIPDGRIVDVVLRFNPKRFAEWMELEGAGSLVDMEYSVSVIPNTDVILLHILARNLFDEVEPGKSWSKVDWQYPCCEIVTTSGPIILRLAPSSIEDCILPGKENGRIRFVYDRVGGHPSPRLHSARLSRAVVQAAKSSCLGSQFKWNRLTRFCVRLLPDLFWPPACPANG